MGYESRIYVVEKMKWEDWTWGNLIAVFDMSKMGHYFVSSFQNVAEPVDFNLYDFNGNTEIKEDCYGQPLTAVPIDSLVRILENIINGGEKYHRIMPLLQFLRQLQTDKATWNGELLAVHYGY